MTKVIVEMSDGDCGQVVADTVENRRKMEEWHGLQEYTLDDITDYNVLVPGKEGYSIGIFQIYSIMQA